MTEASRAFRLQIALAVLSAAVVTTTAVVAVSRVRPDPAAVAASCSQFAPSLSDLAAAIVLSSMLLGFTASVVAVASVARQTGRGRQALRGLTLLEPSSVEARDVRVFVEPRVVAFCAGLLRPQVYISTGAVTSLAPNALRAVVEHERHHARRRDPLRVTVMRACADAFFFIPALRNLAERYSDLAEMAADEAALRRGNGRQALASALVVFDADASPVSPERVDRLLGVTHQWRAPLLLIGRAMGAIAIVATAGVLLALTTAEASVAPAMVSHVCVLILTAALVAPALLLRRGNGFIYDQT